jgi:hypothetical protein
VLVKHGYELTDIAMKAHASELIAFPAEDREEWTAGLLDEGQVNEALKWSRSRVLSTFTSRCRNLIS